MKQINFFFLFVFFNTLIFGQSYSEDKFNSVIEQLLPVPQNIKIIDEKYKLSRSAKVYYSNKTTEISKYISRFRELSGLDLIPVEDNELSDFQIIIRNDKNNITQPERSDIENKGDEAYKLSVTNSGIEIIANSSKGVLWGLMTLAQLIVKDNNEVIIPNVKIIDWSRYPWRGYMLDTGRAPYSVKQIERTIRICSAFKLNFLIIREGDDELNAFKYKNLPLGSDNPYALTLDDFSELIEYGKGYGVTVFPEIESLGHAAAKKKFYPEIIQDGLKEDYWPGFNHIRKSNFDVDNPKTYEVLHAMYEEIFPRLSIPMVHLGLDEVRLPMEKQAEHFKKLLPLVDKVGKKNNMKMDMLVWSDAPPTPKEYRDRVIRTLWVYAEEITPETEAVVNQGGEELLEPGCTQRVFMAGGSGTHHRPHSKECYPGAFINLYSWAKLGENRDNFIGLYAVQWGTNIIDEWFPDFLMAADFGWNVPKVKPEYDSYMIKLGKRLQSLDDYIFPNPEDVPRPAWDGIWLNGNYWDEDIMTGEKASPALTIEPNGGYIKNNTASVGIISSIEGTKIFYTTDGTPPTFTSDLYFEPLVIDSTLSLKAVGYVPGRPLSYVREALFINTDYQSAPKITEKLEQGLQYKYFEAPVISVLYLKDKAPLVQSVVDKIKIENNAKGKEKFSYIFSGFLSIPERGVYTFYLNSNDGSRLYINGKEVINNDGRHGAKEKSVKLSLEKGLFPIELKYFQYGGGKALSLSWKGPGFEKTEISDEYYFHRI